MIRQMNTDCPHKEEKKRMAFRLNKTQWGFTLIELLITIVVLAIFLSLAVPSFRDTIDKRRVVNATTALQSQLQQARSFSILLNRIVYVDISVTTSTNWCFGVTDKATCDCGAAPTSADVCSIAEPVIGSGTPQRINVIGTSTEFPGVGLDVPGGELFLEFEPTRGVLFNPSNPVQFVFESTAGTGRATEINVNRLGRSTVCASGEVLLGGIPQCP